jgi:DNA repair exonuclease SbcCD ATPase subunit
MFIERVEIEEGFLDGLDLDLTPGLNVIIGARGTGKTSLVELIRFALNVRSFSESVERKVQEQVAAVLGRGRVTVTVNVNGESFQISRSVGDEVPRSQRPLPATPATVLSQTEIELIADDSLGRLRLLDGFLPPEDETKESERRATSRVRALTQQMRDVTQRCSSIEESLAALAPIESELEAAELEQQEVLASVEAHEPEKQKLEQLTEHLELLSAREQQLESARDEVSSWLHSLDDVIRASRGLMTADSIGWTELQSAIRKRIQTASDQLAEVASSVTSALDDLAKLNAATTEEYQHSADEARRLRRTLDSAVKGAGAATSRVATLREQLSARPNLDQELRTLRDQAAAIRAERTGVLDEIDHLRNARFDARCRAAESLTQTFHQTIRVELVRYGLHASYSAAIAEALRGTRLHYNQLSQVLSAALSPRELIEAAETDDIAVVTSIAGIDKERASRVLQALRDDGGAEILASSIEDAVEFLLLDGPDYKPSGSLSTGQRCTVVLPMLLEQRDRVMVLDQPEDHLDNSFIVDTVVTALRGSDVSSQRIIATHNANIPVLGEANLVVAMASDGDNGFVDAQGPLDTPAVISSISTILEGGLEAFDRRAEFYGRPHTVD